MIHKEKSDLCVKSVKSRITDTRDSALISWHANPIGDIRKQRLYQF